MKSFTKPFTSILLFILTFSFMTACNESNSGASSSQTPPPSVSSNAIITESVSEMEDMMNLNSNTSIQSMAFSTPNYTVEYANERLSVLRGSGIALYFTKYLATESYNFADDTIYKDTLVVENADISFYAQKTVVDNGVHVTLEMHQTVNELEMVNPIQIYFEYDYTEEKPIKTTIVATTENSSMYSISVAQFDYSTQIAYSYNFQAATSDTAAVKTALTAKNFDFEKFAACTVSYYTFAKLHTSNNTIESYGYTSNGTAESTATSNDVSTLYNSIYGQVKNACVPVDLLDPATAVAKVYYADMWAYGANMISKIT
ncbi:MAG: hypothetical protein IJX88_00280 [Clostridia bacterium]|nr:hypothetical protein [Clostridia bacterium]